MASIIGEKKKWKNAITDDIAAVDSLISSKTNELNNATTMLNQALNAITLCNDKASPNGIFKPGCAAISGRHITSWRDQRDMYMPLVDRYKKELITLQERRTALVNSANESATLLQNVAQTNVATAKANEAIASAETVQATATASKYGIYGIIAGVALILIIGGIYAYKKLKK